MRKSVLLVDDDADARSIFGNALEEKGYRVYLAVHGAEAVHLARRYRPDLIVMDIRMPVMDAWAALRYLRTDPKLAGQPIWALSAFVEEESADRTRAQQFDRMLSKPVDPADLVAAVDGYFGRAAPLTAQPE
ncbi:MAG: response regulator [Gemmatimonadota bacterium]